MNFLHELTLHPRHKEDLEKSGLSENTILETAIFSVCPADINRKLGFQLPGIQSMYEIPYGSEYSRYKIFYEEGQEFDKNGEKKPKYLAKKESRNRLYIPKKIKPLLSDVSKPLYITEGEKKTLKAVQEGINCIAISGLWNWKVKGEDTLIPDFNLIKIKGRTISIVPDNDWLTINRRGEKKNLKQAVYDLAYRLIDRGAKVYWVELPVQEEKIGLDDYLCAGSREKFNALRRHEIKRRSIDEEIEQIDTDKKEDMKSVLRRIARLASESERELYIKALAHKMQVPLRSIRKDITKLLAYQREIGVPHSVDAIINKLNEKHAIIEVNGRFWVLNEIENPISYRPDISLSTVKDFHVRYANRKLGNKNIAAHWLEHENRRELKGIVFAPLKTTPGYYNLWRGFAVEPKEGDCSLYLQHIKENIASNDEALYNYLIAWMADAVQNPDDKKGVAIVLRGKQGVGKGVACSEFGKLFGQHYIHIQNSHHLVGKFNFHFKDALIVFADEAFWAGDKASEGILRGMITEPLINIESKGKDMYRIKNHIHLMMASNNDWIVPAGLEERRFCVIDVSDAHMQESEYFKKIVHQMDHGGREALFYSLMHYNVTGMDLRKFPHTHALFEQKILSMSPVQKFWFYKLWNGSQFNESDEWIMGPIARKRLQDEYFEFAREANFRHPGDASTLGIEMRRLVPSLREVRPRSTDGKRYRAYQFLSLKECREHFEKIIKTKISWQNKSAAHTDPQGALKQKSRNNLEEGSIT